jgi:ATP-dependent DNA helicase RecQ
MTPKIITLSYDPALDGFSDEALRRALAECDVLSMREYFYEVGGLPRLTLVLETQPRNAGVRPGNRPRGPDQLERLPDDRKKLYLDMKRWRNETADKEGMPPFTILRNELLAEIVLSAPQSKAALREIKGVGEKTVEKYGDAILGLIPDGLASADPV